MRQTLCVVAQMSWRRGKQDRDDQLHPVSTLDVKVMRMIKKEEGREGKREREREKDALLLNKRKR